MNPLKLFPRRINILRPDIRIGASVAHRQVNILEALELLRSGYYRQDFSTSGEFLGLLYAPEQAHPPKARYMPEELPPLELPGLMFRQPANATPTYLRTVTPAIQ